MCSQICFGQFNIRSKVVLLFSFSVPDSPHEPDPESYEPMPPRLIPLDEVHIFMASLIHMQSAI